MNLRCMTDSKVFNFITVKERRDDIFILAVDDVAASITEETTSASSTLNLMTLSDKASVETS